MRSSRSDRVLRSVTYRHLGEHIDKHPWIDRTGFCFDMHDFQELELRAESIANPPSDETKGHRWLDMSPSETRRYATTSARPRLT